MLGIPAEHKLHEQLIQESRLTRMLERHVCLRMDEESSGRVWNSWFRVAHWFLRHLRWFHTGIHPLLYAAAILLAASGKVLAAVFVGCLGIVISKKLTELQTMLQARKMAYYSIRDHTRRKKRDRRRDPLV